MAAKKLYEVIEKDLNENERYLIDASDSHDTGVINQTKVISEIYLAKRLDKTADRIIASSEKTAAAQNKYARALNWLTGGLFFVGIVQIVFIALSAFKVI